MIKEVKFAKDYKKLEQHEFATLRLEPKESKFKKNEEYKVVTPTREFNVVCTHITASHLKMISTPFLMNDTDEPTRERAIAHLSKYYPELNEETVLTAIFLKKIGVGI